MANQLVFRPKDMGLCVKEAQSGNTRPLEEASEWLSGGHTHMAGSSPGQRQTGPKQLESSVAGD